MVVVQGRRLKVAEIWICSSLAFKKFLGRAIFAG